MAKIKNRFTGDIIAQDENKTVAQLCNENKLYLRDADLSGANLRGANLRGANLCYAKWKNDALLIGKRPYMEISPIGSESGTLQSILTDQGQRVQRGCFEGSLDEFIAAVEAKHADTEYGPEYRAAIELLKAHAEQRTPAENKETA